jgi:hypothetical protein
MSDELKAHISFLLNEDVQKLAEWDRVGRTYDSETFSYRDEIVQSIRFARAALLNV